MKRLFGFDRLSTSDNLFGRTIPRRLSKERFWFSRFRQWLIKTETWKWRLDNFSVFSGFLGLRAEVTFRKWKSGIYESEKSSGKCIVIIFWFSKGFRAEVTFENKTPEFRNLTSWAEIETFRLCWRQLLWILTQFCRNSVWILFWENFYNYLLRNIFSEDWKLKIIALIYGRFDLRAFCVELTLRFWQTFRILRAESAFRQSWKRQAESLFEANLRHSAESKTTENKLNDKTPNP